jgi:hypothetical protein
MSNVKGILREELNSGATLVVTFEKTNGDKRVMKCTRNMSKIPQPPVTEGTNIEPRKPRKQPEGVAVVWDLEKSDWRSFRYDSVISVSVVEDE